MYSPKIGEQHIPVLYHLGKRVKKPMTRLVDEAIKQYLEREAELVESVMSAAGSNKRHYL